MDFTSITALSALLIAGGVVLLALLVLAVLTDRPSTARPDPDRLRAAAEELEAYAVATQTEAGRAAAVAAQARAELAAAEHSRDLAWAEQEAAERDYDRAWQSALAGREAAAPDPPDRSERDREVSRAALAAYRRGDISLQELREVFRRCGDWDPAQEERERLLDRVRMRQAMARRDYDRAAALARRAEQEAWAAEEAAWALQTEASRSVAEAHEAYLTVQRYAREHGRPRKKRRRRAG